MGEYLGLWKEKRYNFTKTYLGFNLEELQADAKARGMKIIMHYATIYTAVDYERQLDDDFSFMNKNGYTAVKTGYIGPIIARSGYHDGQWMVNHYNFVTQKAPQYNIMVNSHEAARSTGISCTYPNWIAQDSTRGIEFESFNGNGPIRPLLYLLLG